MDKKLREINEIIHNIKIKQLCDANIRSKTQLHPESEQTTFYHLAKERHQRSRKSISFIETNEGSITNQK